MRIGPATIARHAVLVAFSAAIVLPLLWVFRVSLTDKLTAYKIPPEIGKLSFDNYVEVFASHGFTHGLL
jgi:multiple sugar transport system permease protein